MSSTDNYADGYDAKIIIEGKDAEIERLKEDAVVMMDQAIKMKNEITRLNSIITEQYMAKLKGEAAKHE